MKNLHIKVCNMNVTKLLPAYLGLICGRQLISDNFRLIHFSVFYVDRSLNIF